MSVMELRRRVEASRCGRAYARLPADVKRLVVEHARARRASGASWRVIGREVGVDDKRLQVWLRDASSARPAAATALALRPRMIPVRVTARAVQATMRREIVVRGPRGVSVEGLSVSDVAALLKELSS
jgi:hypothetical protein